MLTKITHYEQFLIDYYNLSERVKSEDGMRLFQNAYIQLDHDKDMLPNHNGYCIVPSHLVQCFLLWWKERKMLEKKHLIH